MNPLALPIVVAGAPDWPGVLEVLGPLEARPMGPDSLEGMAVRVAFAWKDLDDFDAKKALVVSVLGAAGPLTALSARGIHVGSGGAPKVAFLYPGQGSQYVGMFGELRQLSTAVADTFSEADAVMSVPLGRRLSDAIFPGPGIRAEQELTLRATELAQPAVLAADVAITRLLATYGILPDLLLGHSLGEYAAMVTAGVLTYHDALTAISVRGPEIARLEAVDPGKMASVSAPYEHVVDLLAELGGTVMPANKNSYMQTVVAGGSADVVLAVERFRQRGIEASLIPVSHAFHSSILDPAIPAMTAALQRLPMGAPRVPVVSSVSGRLVPSDPAAILGLLARQITSPVEFTQGLETAWDLGARLFLEVGPNRVLTGFANDVLGPRGAHTQFTNHPRKPDRLAFADCIASLWAAGVGINPGAPA